MVVEVKRDRVYAVVLEKPCEYGEVDNYIFLWKERNLYKLAELLMDFVYRSDLSLEYGDCLRILKMAHYVQGEEGGG